MQIQKYIAPTDSDLPADDIDILFSQLQTIEPSPTLTARILDQLLPRPEQFRCFFSQWHCIHGMPGLSVTRGAGCVELFAGLYPFYARLSCLFYLAVLSRNVCK